MKPHQLSLKSKTNSRRSGRGIAAGRGKTAGRGTKGQRARSGVHLRPTFEGGQNPLIMRLPKQRGFRSHRLQPQLVKTGQLNNFRSGSSVGPTELLAADLITNLKRPVRLVVGGKLNKSLNLVVHGASQTAKQSVTAAKGTLKIAEFTPIQPPKDTKIKS